MKFNDVFDLLSELQMLGIKIHLENNKLKIKGNKNNLTEEILNEVKQNKQEIISFLESNSIKKEKIEILPFKRDVKLPLSFAQERLWFIDQYEHNASYNMPGAAKLIGKLDVNVLEKTFTEIIRRHEVLRTNIVTIDNEASQLIHEESKFELKTVDQSHLSEQEANQRILDLIEIESQTPFDLANDSLIRLVLYKISDEEHTLFLNKHHIISDGWSYSVLFREISILYKAFSENWPSPLPELKIQYADYAMWQREHIEGDILNKQSEYWKNKLSNTEILELPTDRTRPDKQTFNGASLHLSIDNDLTEKLNVFSKENDTSLFMTLVSVFKVLLNKYTGQEDICVGSPIANRTRSEIEPLIGFFANTLALRSDLSGDISFVELLKQVKQSTLEAYDNQDMPFEKVVELVQPERNLSYSPLFQVMLVLQNTPKSELSFGELSLKQIELQQANSNSKFDLTINLTESTAGLVGEIEYNTDLFNKDRIERMIEHFKVLARSIISNPTVKISELEVLTAEEKHKLLVEWNDTQANYSKDQCVHQLFEQQVEKAPDNVAVVFENKQLSYRELNEKSNQLAHYLQSKGVKPDSLVGICVDRSLEMLVGLLGILKAGGAYVPIDPTYPEDRISFMIEDADCEIVLTQKHIELPKTNSEIIYLDADWDKIENGSIINPQSEVQRDHLVYVIYTSGSTGRPKGVMLEHKNLTNLINYTLAETNIDLSCVLQFASLSFDVSAQEIFSTLSFGGKLCLIDNEVRLNMPELYRVISTHEIKTVYWPVSLTKMIFSNGNALIPKCVDHIITAGEQLVISKNFSKYLKDNGTYVHNQYGPSETHVVTTLTIKPNDEHIEYPSIGKPISNTSAYILNDEGHLAPINVVGELYVSGYQIGRGYVRQAELTADRFIRNPFSEDPNSKLYRTGDLVKYLPDGNIEFIGRIDNQEKIRGFRVELGEIESVLYKIESVEDSVVIAKQGQDGNKRLVAYIVADNDLNVQEIRQKLSESLPDYMIPSLFVELETMPLTPNGKIDKKALPEPEGNIETTNEYVAPRNETEQKLADIWMEVLGIDKVGVYDNFFELGGHSLLATQVISKIRTEFNIELPLKLLFEKPDLFNLSETIESTKSESNITKITVAPRDIDLPLSFAQERLWFIDQYERNASYNMPGAVKLIGKLDVNVLEKTFAEIIRRHEVLRTNIVSIDNKACQRINDNSKFELQKVDQSHLPEEDADQKIQELIEIESQKPFDLANENLIRLVLYKISDEEHTLFLNKHHIISDGWSYSVLFREISIIYKAFSENKPSPLPELEIQYADYAIWQREHIEGEILTQQSEYWKNKLSNTTILELPTDKTRPGEQSFNGANLHFSLDKDLTENLNAFSKENDVSLFMILLSVLKVLLNRYTGQKDICVGSPIANRTRSEIEPLIGFFVNTLALRSELSGDVSFVDLLKQVKQITLEAYDNQDMPFEKVVDIVQTERNLSYSPLFQVMLVLQNTPVSELSFGELSLKPIEFESRISKFDLSMNFTETAEGLVGEIEYNTDLFEKDRIERMIGHFKVLARSIISDPTVNISELEILTSAEKHKLLLEWNDTEVDYPKDKCIHQLFEEQVEKTPDKIAVVFENKQLTYRELNEKSNQLAHYLQSKGVKPDSLVGICVDRSIEMIIGLLGILKAGGAYVPIDPTYPEERISFILEDADCELILSQEHIELPETSSELIYLDADWYKIENEALENTESDVKSDNLAYVIYTSGSTGQPKGVMIKQENLINFLLSMGKYPGIEENDRLLALTSVSFDIHTLELYMPLIRGAYLSIASNTVSHSADLLAKAINEESITMAQATPATWKMLLGNGWRPTKPLKILCGGEAIDEQLKQELLAYPSITLFNMYGPTETTVWSTTMELVNGQEIFIGKPIDNTQLYITDEDLNLTPIGVPGELCISGVGLARGYLKRTELTAEKFFKNPFSNDPYSRLYKTGDLVKYLPDGNIEFIGRLDNQVKVRGFRIELGEIESVLNKMVTIKDSVVVAKEDSDANKQLVAYIVSGVELNVDIQEIREELSKSLPDYMVPSLFVELEKMPLTPNGKIDRKALPEPEVKAGEDYHAPSSEVEETLVEIWAEVLDIDKNEISINKSFFEIGGNSLLSIKLQKKLSQINEFKHITIPELFKYHTINKLIQSIKQNKLPEYKLQNKTGTSNHEIAIIGMSGAFTGVSNIAEFWQLIKNQDEGIRFFSKDECENLGVDTASFDDPAYIPVAGALKDIELFDPLFWEISPNEAKLLDPQIRKFIEHCWFVLESSGYSSQRKDYNIGVFAGSGSETYFYNNIMNGEMASHINLWEASIANSKGALATKTSYMLGLSGPANSINTACSTGLVSVVEACKNLQLGSCEMALAGGVSLAMPNQIGYTYQEGMILSEDGHCRTFDKGASGTTGGSGVGVVFLKRLDNAISDGDNIIGVIKGYSTNNDGDRKTGYTAPSVTGQAECIINAQKMARISSSEIEYVECHGTATELGDPIEVQALKDAFEFNENAYKPKNKTVLGAVKANIGHADSAAGTAGLIKTCLMLQNDIIPGQPNFDTPNPKLNLDQTNFEITKDNKEWLPNPNKQRLAGVSSFGLGGTNAHVILGDYTPEGHTQKENDVDSLPLKNEQASVNFVVPISAKCKQSLELYKEQLLKYLTDVNKTELSISDIAYSLQEKRECFNFRSAYSARDIDELINKLTQNSSIQQANEEFKGKAVFMFPGQGSQYTFMAKDLYNNDQFFRKTIDELISLANQHLDVDLYQVIYPQEEQTKYDINETRWAQISLFIIQYALAKYLEDLGIRPDAYIGHSIGEYTAATLSGVFALEDAIKTVIARAKLMQSMQAGSMLAINAKKESIHAIVQNHNCEIAVVNSIEDIVVSGYDADINALKAILDKQSIASVVLNTSHAYHSRMMEDAANKFESVFANLTLNKPQKVFISNLTGEIANDEVINPAYWCNQLRNTVQFANGISRLAEKYNNKINFIEVGTGKGLSSFVTKFKNSSSRKTIRAIQILPSEKENTKTYNSIKCKEDIIAKLWISGIIEKPNDLKLFKQAKLLVNLPSYQFNYKKCWLEAKNDIAVKRPEIQLNENLSQNLQPTLKGENFTETEFKIAQIWNQILGVEEIGVHDDFFELGGHSLLATQVISKIRTEFNIELPLKTLFEKSNLLNLSKIIENQKSESEIAETAVVTRDTDLPLSFAQERLWFIDQYERNASYNMTGAVKLIGKLDIKVLEKTFSEIIRRHEVLRTNIVTIDNEASQLIHEESKFELETVDQSHLSEQEANQKILELIEVDSQKPFDLANDSLIRLVLYKITDEEHTLFYNKHHIISDGWSFSVFFREISILYKAFSENKPSPLPELEIQYADYAVWQREHIEGDVLNKQSEYWKNKLSNTSILELPTDRTRPDKQTFNGANLHFSFDKDLTEKLNVFSKENDATFFMTLLSVFKVLLYKYTGQEDICVGSPIANRTRSEVEPLIGFFVNTLALRSDLSGDISFLDLLKQIKQSTLDAYDNQDIPFEKVVDIVQPERNLSYSPLFQVMMVLQNTPVSELSFGELSLKPIEFESRVSKFDLTMNLSETEEGLIGGMEYNTDLFNKDRIERMIEHFKVLINSMISNPTANISELEILTSKEKHQLLVEWNDTQANYSKDQCVHQLFEQQVEKAPDNVAVVFENKQLTYRELNEKSNQLAHYLQSKGVKPDSLVGICVERSLEMIVGLYGILKAGGAYVPVDPTYPEDRVSFMIADADCEIVLTQKHIELPKTNSEVIYIDADWDKVENGSIINLQSEVKTDHLVYVIYTSGSTGRPKGVMLEHKNLTNLINYTLAETNIDLSSVLQFASLSFDVSAQEIFSTLSSGGKLCLINNEVRLNMPELSRVISTHEIKTVYWPVSLTKMIFNNGNSIIPQCVDHIITAGEQLLINPNFSKYLKDNGTYVHNHYGPSETHVVTTLTIKPNDEYVEYPSIGKPISNTSVYILNKDEQLVPINVVGELYVSGCQIGRGYVKQAELTADRFIRNPFSEDPNSKLYRTGDLARYLPNGNIEFIGRIDNQEKIRGFRVELGEIESVLNKITGVKDCVVIAMEGQDGNKHLVAYIVAINVNVQEIRKKLSESLPDYMIPSLFVELEKMPLTPNGKIDKKALPDPEGNIETTNEYVAPRNETEQKLAEIWMEVLGVDKVGIYDNFFELGGHSLLATQVISKIRNEFNIELPLKTLFENTSIIEFSPKIDSIDGNNKISKIKKLEKKGLLQEKDKKGTSENTNQEKARFKI